MCFILFYIYHFTQIPIHTHTHTHPNANICVNKNEHFFHTKSKMQSLPRLCTPKMFCGLRFSLVSYSVIYLWFTLPRWISFLCFFSFLIFFFLFRFFLSDKFLSFLAIFVGLSLKSSSWTKLCISHPFVLNSNGDAVFGVFCLFFGCTIIYGYKFRQAKEPIGKYYTEWTVSFTSNKIVVNFPILQSKC